MHRQPADQVIRDVVARSEAVLGLVDVLIDNHTHSVHDGHFAVNARACALMMSDYIQRYLGRQGRRGRIINVSTDAAHAHASSLSYAASKLTPDQEAAISAGTPLR